MNQAARFAVRSEGWVMPNVLMKALARKRSGFMVFPGRFRPALKSNGISFRRPSQLLHPAALPAHLFFELYLKRGNAPEGLPLEWCEHTLKESEFDKEIQCPLQLSPLLLKL